MNLLANLNLSYNQLQNALMHPTSLPPTNPKEGQIYFNTTGGDKKLYYYNGTDWVSTDADNFADSLAFSSATGNLTIGRSGTLPDITTNLDGRYLTSHPTITAASSVNNSGRTYIQGITLDANGHITGITSATETVTDTTYTANGGITLTGNNFAHTNVVTASNFGDTGVSRTLSFGGTFTVPYVTYDANGHLVTKSNITLTMPSASSSYPTTFGWTAGTTSGPTGSLTGVGMSAVPYSAIPSATGTESGVVTTAAQIFGGDKTFNDSVVISGNLTVNGTVTTVNTETIMLADNLITLNSNYSGSTPTENGGIEIERGTLANSSLIWNESTDKWQISSDSVAYYDIVSSSNFMSTSIGDGTLTTIPVTHNWGTREVMVQVYDNATFDTILCDVVRTDNNVVTLYFAVAPTLNAYKVLLHKLS